MALAQVRWWRENSLFRNVVNAARVGLRLRLRSLPSSSSSVAVAAAAAVVVVVVVVAAGGSGGRQPRFAGAARDYACLPAEHRVKPNNGACTGAASCDLTWNVLDRQCSFERGCRLVQSTVVAL